MPARDSPANGRPFDQFTIHQVAGDLLPDADQDSRVGSAFNRLLLSTDEGGAQAQDYEARMLTDRVRAIGVTARRTLNIVWALPELPPADITEELAYLCPAMNLRFVVVSQA